MSGAKGYHRYWGKAGDADASGTFHRLVYHCLDVAAVGHALARERPRWIRSFSKMVGIPPEQLVSALVFLLVLHDLGKFGHGFQSQLPDLVTALGGTPGNVANKPRHDSIGWLLWRELSDPRESFGPDWSAEAALLDVQIASESISAKNRRKWLTPWFAAVCGHHGRPPEIGLVVMKSHFGPNRESGVWRDAMEFLGAVRQLLKPPPLRVVDRDLDACAVGFRSSSWWLAGFTVLCDWIGSNREWFPFEQEVLPLEEYWALALERAAVAVAEAGLAAPSLRSFPGFGELFRRDEKPLVPSPLQAKAAEVALGQGPQLFLLEDLTGSGKTEAALTLVARLLEARRADGFYFALPTMATANAMHARVREVLPRLFETVPSYVLAHSGPHLAGPNTGLAAGQLERQPLSSRNEGEDTASRAVRSWLSDSRKKALLADVGVGTIDQALIGVLRAKHNSLRLLGLHGHVLVVDEVHACDEYMNGILEEVLQVQASMGGSAVLMSATLPKRARQRLVDAFRRGLGAGSATLGEAAYPCFVHADRDSASADKVEAREDSARTVGIEFLHSIDETLDWCVSQAGKGRCVAWIRNTVREAMDAYDALAARLKPDQVQVFHARFPLGDRLLIEQDIVARFGRRSTSEARAGRVVVATQVMEQSLDIDFDDMVSDLAPIDRLIQRCGRMQRHERGDRGTPTLHVLAPEWTGAPTAGWPGTEFTGTLRVYLRPSTLWRTQWALRHRNALELPAQARWLVEAVFGAEPEEMEVPSVLLESDRELKADSDRLMKGAMAKHNQIAFDYGYQREGSNWSDDERAPTRLGEPTTLIRLVRRVEGRLQPWSNDISQAPGTRWRLGEASVRASQLWAGGADEERLREELEALGAEVPPHIVPIAMQREGEVWSGLGRSAGGEPVTVSFQPGRGLSFVRNAKG